MGKTRKRNQLNPKTIKYKKPSRKRGSTKKSKAQQRQRKTRKVFGGANMNDPPYSFYETIVKNWLNKLGLHTVDEGIVNDTIKTIIDDINKSTIKDKIVSTFDTICHIAYIVYKLHKHNENNPEKEGITSANLSSFILYIINIIDAYKLKKNWEDCAIEEEGFQTPIYEDFIKKILPENFIDGYHDKGSYDEGSYDDGLDIRMTWELYDIWTIVNEQNPLDRLYDGVGIYSGEMFKDIPINFPLRAFCCKNSLNAANVVNAFMSAADTHDVSHAQRSAGVHLFRLANGFACIPVSGTICDS